MGIRSEAGRALVLREQRKRFAFTTPQQRERSAFTSRQVPARRAFTLVEMLVVITIVIVLMGLLFPAFRGAQDQSKKVQAKNDLNQIVTGITAFYTEYGKYPVPGSANRVPDDYWILDSNIADICNVLRANGSTWDSTSGQNLNPKRVAFLQPPLAKDPNQPRNGICPSGANAGKYYDPWGSTYRLRIDWDYDNNLTNPYSQGAGTNPLLSGVIGFSIGKDQQSAADNNSGRYRVSGQPGNGDDDVISWQ
jgi:prepilin-type N-terminal cleavage/methylation domain-containing protein